MSNVFLAISSAEPGDFEGPVRAAARYLPILPEQSFEHISRDRCSGLWAWSVFSEAARGSFWAAEGDEALAYNGWVTEDSNVPMSKTVAAGLLDILGRRTLDHAARRIDGDWSMVRLGSQGQIDGLCDFMGGQHLYFGCRRGRSAVSNRALLVAAALYDGVLPTMETNFFAWLLTSVAAPVGNQTPFPDVFLLDPGERLRLHKGTWETTPIPAVEGEEHCWESFVENFKCRAAQLKRLPGVSAIIALTGGKDSRLVLAGMAASNTLEYIDHAYLRAAPDHPDVTVGRRLAEHYGLEFRLLEPPDRDGDFLESIGRHGFQTEFALNAWDMKGFESRERVATIHGLYGEIYRGHANLGFALGWHRVEAKYLPDSYIDLAGIMTEALRTDLTPLPHSVIQLLDGYAASDDGAGRPG
ncbi:MAG: hypothetical protein ACNA8W_23275 [Bradymonadaceae bacterium]